MIQRPLCFLFSFLLEVLIFLLHPNSTSTSGSKPSRRLHGQVNNRILVDTAVLRAPIRKQSLEFVLHSAELEYDW